jgi:hypothetical protein
MMNARTNLVRNLFLSIVNGSVTLIILLIAPLGLAAVIINTILVAAATFLTASVSDRIVLFLAGDSGRQMRSVSMTDANSLNQGNRGDLRR